MAGLGLNDWSHAYSSRKYEMHRSASAVFESKPVHQEWKPAENSKGFTLGLILPHDLLLHSSVKFKPNSEVVRCTFVFREYFPPLHFKIILFQMCVTPAHTAHPCGKITITDVFPNTTMGVCESKFISFTHPTDISRTFHSKAQYVLMDQVTLGLNIPKCCYSRH